MSLLGNRASLSPAALAAERSDEKADAPAAPALATAGAAAEDQPVAASRYPTIWGLDPVGLHDYFWAARGVFVVRQGQAGEIPAGAELYLLTDADTLALFRLAPIIERFSWGRPTVMFLRMMAARGQDYREVVVTDRAGRFERFRRLYARSLAHDDGRNGAIRLAITRDRGIASVWQLTPPAQGRAAWRHLRRQARVAGRDVAHVRGRAYSRRSDEQLAEMASHLLQGWDRPSATVAGIRRLTPKVWAHRDATIGGGVRFIDSVWVGAGRRVPDGAKVLGPAILWDDPAHRPQANRVLWSELEPSHRLPPRPAAAPGVARRGPRGKRLFDVVVSLAVLAVTLPFYPLIILAIVIEDGWPPFFAHRRQTLGGREFNCIKFRSMRRNAEVVKRQLAALNKADGPQFYFEHDPRLTRVGSFLRRTHLDELPQFINVLMGDMSIVGPRPSPSDENQFNPAWREARLSVRAGITGLWQVRRTRRPGLDFQEWIKYDLEYVRNSSWWMDLSIMFKTARKILGGQGK